VIPERLKRIWPFGNKEDDLVFKEDLTSVIYKALGDADPPIEEWDPFELAEFINDRVETFLIIEHQQGRALVEMPTKCGFDKKKCIGRECNQWINRKFGRSYCSILFIAQSLDYAIPMLAKLSGCTLSMAEDDSIKVEKNP
jgi:hypothetical protein